MFAIVIVSFLDQFSAVAGGCNHAFFGLIPWYAYLNVAPDPVTKACAVSGFNTLGGNSGFLLIGLAILDDLLRVAALVSVGFVIAGGIKYITSQGEPGAVQQAKGTVLNALVGLVIAMVAATVVAFLGNRLGG